MVSDHKQQHHLRTQLSPPDSEPLGWAQQFCSRVLQVIQYLLTLGEPLIYQYHQNCPFCILSTMSIAKGSISAPLDPHIIYSKSSSLQVRLTEHPSVQTPQAPRKVSLKHSSAEFRSVLCHLSIHVLCLPSLLGEGPCLSLLTDANC